MRIGIDGFSLARNDSGIEVYTRELVNGMLRFNDVELYTYTDTNVSSEDNLAVKNAGLKAPSTFQKLQWQLFGVTELISPDIDVYHCPHFILPKAKITCRKVVTVHDLAFLKYPQFFDWKTRLYYKLFLRKSLENADAIICISKSCQDDVLKYFPSQADKTKLIHNGFKDFSKIPPSQGILNRLGIAKEFLLVIGTLNPRKNIGGAIRAFEQISPTHDVDLVVVGDLSQTHLHKSNRNKRIHFTGYITDQELSALYRTASLLLFPSYYEGFGFPILEAMSVGLPVVTSNISSMPEISGYPPEYLCDPGSVTSISALIVRMLRERSVLLSHGDAVIRNFSWEKMVKLTHEAYAGV
jgi:glycosyltransferase involved in cell wall biosynthesis